MGEGGREWTNGLEGIVLRWFSQEQKFLTAAALGLWLLGHDHGGTEVAHRKMFDQGDLDKLSKQLQNLSRGIYRP